MHTRKRARVEKKQQEASGSSHAVANGNEMSDAPAMAAAAAAVSSQTQGPHATPPSIHGASAAAAAAAAPPVTAVDSSAVSLSRGAEFEVHRRRLLRLMDAFPQLVADMADTFERRVEQITAATAIAAAVPHASSNAATSVAASSPAASSHVPLVLLPPQHRARLDALRDHALVPGVVALVLSFVPIRRRIHLGRMCRRWQSALQQSSLWIGSGWHGDLDIQNIAHLPPTILRHMSVLRCGEDWLLQSNSLQAFRCVPQLRRLDVLHCRHDAATDVSATTVQKALQSLRLEVLTLPPLEQPRCHALIEALAAPGTAAAPPADASSSSSPQPLLARWSPTLTELHLFIPADADSLMLRALAELHWPALRFVAIWLANAKDHKTESEKAAQLLQQAVSPQRMPELQELHCHMEAPSEPGAFSPLPWLPIIPPISTLTSLTIGSALFIRPLSALTLFRAIGAHNLPSLSRLELQGSLQASVGQSEAREVEQILQRMDSLTQLSVSIQPEGDQGAWLHLLHLLPSLLILHVDDCDPYSAIHFGSAGLSPCLQSISAAPKLQSLSVPSGRLIARLAQLWWRRLGQPQLDLSGADEDEWAELQEQLSEFDGNSAASSTSAAAAASASSLVGPAVPAIREFKVSREFESVLDGCALAYLAHLPHLHTLDCALPPADLAHLALLRQLRSLTLWLHVPGEYLPNGAAWTAAAVRTIGSTRLPLHTLRLEGDDESSSAYHQDPADPNFPWRDAESEHDEDAPVRATHAAIPVDHGLDHLLRLPALTRLALPYVDRDALDLLRCMAAGDRPALFIERIIPHSRRSDFDKRWIEHDLPAFPRDGD